MVLAAAGGGGGGAFVLANITNADRNRAEASSPQRKLKEMAPRQSHKANRSIAAHAVFVVAVVLKPSRNKQSSGHESHGGLRSLGRMQRHIEGNGLGTLWNWSWGVAGLVQTKLHMALCAQGLTPSTLNRKQSGSCSFEL